MTASPAIYGIVGLGDPGKEYEHTRHDMGFKVLDLLAERHEIKLKRKLRFKARAGTGRISSNKVMLCKPLTYMNLSGTAVQPALQFYQSDAAHLIVVVDDVELEAGVIRVRRKGSSGGHNGLKSLIQSLGTDAFCRIRIGVGRKSGRGLKGHVLSKFSRDEEALIEPALQEAADAVEKILRDGVDASMNVYNRKKEENTTDN